MSVVARFGWIDLVREVLLNFDTVTIANNTETVLGQGSINTLSQRLDEFGITRPLICTDQGLVEVGLCEILKANLKNGMVGTFFDMTPANPGETDVYKAAELFKKNRCNGVIGFGGGSSLDLAKAVALVSNHSEELVNYTVHRGGVGKIGPIAPLIAIPTTSGTGSEVARASVIILRSGEKRIIASPHMIPKVSILDPDLTISLPPALTASTGMDAVSHCLESICSPVKNLSAEAIGFCGLSKAIGDGALLKAFENGSNKNARYDMLTVSTQGGMAFSKGLGAVHAMSHACGKNEQLRLHHGTLNAVLLPDVLRFNEESILDKLPKIREAMGLKENSDLPLAIEEINRQFSLPRNLFEMGLNAQMIPELAAHCVDDMCSATNPRKMDLEAYTVLFESAFRR